MTQLSRARSSNATQTGETLHGTRAPRQRFASAVRLLWRCVVAEGALLAINMSMCHGAVFLSARRSVFGPSQAGPESAARQVVLSQAAFSEPVVAAVGGTTATSTTCGSTSTSARRESWGSCAKPKANPAPDTDSGASESLRDAIFACSQHLFCAPTSSSTSTAYPPRAGGVGPLFSLDSLQTKLEEVREFLGPAARGCLRATGSMQVRDDAVEEAGKLFRRAVTLDAKVKLLVAACAAVPEHRHAQQPGLLPPPDDGLAVEGQGAAASASHDLERHQGVGASSSSSTRCTPLTSAGATPEAKMAAGVAGVLCGQDVFLHLVRMALAERNEGDEGGAASGSSGAAARSLTRLLQLIQPHGPRLGGGSQEDEKLVELLVLNAPVTTLLAWLPATRRTHGLGSTVDQQLHRGASSDQAILASSRAAPSEVLRRRPDLVLHLATRMPQLAPDILRKTFLQGWKREDVDLRRCGSRLPARKPAPAAAEVDKGFFQAVIWAYFEYITHPRAECWVTGRRMQYRALKSFLLRGAQGLRAMSSWAASDTGGYDVDDGSSYSGVDEFFGIAATVRPELIADEDFIRFCLKFVLTTEQAEVILLKYLSVKITAAAPRTSKDPGGGAVVSAVRDNENATPKAGCNLSDQYLPTGFCGFARGPCPRKEGPPRPPVMTSKVGSSKERALLADFLRAVPPENREVSKLLRYFPAEYRSSAQFFFQDALPQRGLREPAVDVFAAAAAVLRADRQVVLEFLRRGFATSDSEFRAVLRAMPGRTSARASEQPRLLATGGSRAGASEVLPDVERLQEDIRFLRECAVAVAKSAPGGAQKQHRPGLPVGPRSTTEEGEGMGWGGVGADILDEAAALKTCTEELQRLGIGKSESETLRDLVSVCFFSFDRFVERRKLLLDHMDREHGLWDRARVTPAAAESRTRIVFGYGSLIWKVDFPFVNKFPCRVRGFLRRFWMKSADHRGTVEFPGRVCTLVQDEKGLLGKVQRDGAGVGATVVGMAYEIAAADLDAVLKKLDVRERHGYTRDVAVLERVVVGPATPTTGTRAWSSEEAFVYYYNSSATGTADEGEAGGHDSTAAPGEWENQNSAAPHYRGAIVWNEDIAVTAAIIAKAVGPSGPNVEYLNQLRAGVRELLQTKDEYLEALHDEVARLL